MELDTDSGRLQLAAKWERLETVCHRLWAENSPAAVGVQILVEEFKEETRNAGSLLASYRRMLEEQRQTIARELADGVSEKIRGLESQSSRDAERIAALNEALSQKEAMLQDALTQLAAARAEKTDLHDKSLRSASENEEIQAKRMAALQEELLNKRAELEAVWEERRKSLEMADKERAEAAERRQRDLDAAHERFAEEKRNWDLKMDQAEQSLLLRSQEIARVARDGKANQAELGHFKEALKREIAKVVQHYAVKLRKENLDVEEKPPSTTDPPDSESHEEP